MLAEQKVITCVSSTSHLSLAKELTLERVEKLSKNMVLNVNFFRLRLSRG